MNGEARQPARTHEFARGLFLAACACALLWSAAPRGWALRTEDDSSSLLLTGSTLPANPQFVLPTLSGLSGPQNSAAAVNRVQFLLEGKRKLSFDAFISGGNSKLSGLSPRRWFGLTGTPESEGWGLPSLVPRTALDSTRGLDDQAQSVTVGMDSDRGRFSLNYQSVGAKFSATGADLQDLTPQQVQALARAAGTTAFNFEGSYRLSDGLAFSSTRRSTSNDKPGDGNRGQTKTDWTNTLSLTLGSNTAFRLAFTDHDESANAAGKGGAQKRTTELGGETKFGAGGKYQLKFGLTDVQSTAGGTEQSERTQELHLALPLHTRLRLTGDYTRKESGAASTTTTNSLGALLQLAPGTDLTANWKSLTQGDDKRTEEMFLKLTGAVGHGSSALRFTGEQMTTRTPEAGLLRTAKFDLTGGPGLLGFRATYQGKRGDALTDPLEQLATVHLDRAFGPHLKLVLEAEQKLQGTVGKYDSNAKSLLGLALELTPRTRLTAGVSAAANGGNANRTTAWTRDLFLEHRLGALQFRAETHLVQGPVPQTETGFGVDWAHGKLADWAASISRRHEFGDIYEYKVAREATWLDLPFAGTRLWVEQRSGGPDNGADSFLVSHRMMLGKRLHLQLTYHQQPEFEEGANKGRPQPLHREYLELGAPLTRALVGRAWLTREFRVDDPLSERRTLGLGLCGKLSNQAQTELYLSRETGRWEQKAAERNVLAVLYDRKVNEEDKLLFKLGYAWGQSTSPAGPADYRATVSFAKVI